MTDLQFHDVMELIKYIAGGSGALIFFWILTRD